MRLATLLQLLKPSPSLDDARAIAAFVQAEQQWLTYKSSWGRSIAEHDPQVLRDLREAFPQFTWTTRVTSDEDKNSYVAVEVATDCAREEIASNAKESADMTQKAEHGEITPAHSSRVAPCDEHDSDRERAWAFISPFGYAFNSKIVTRLAELLAEVRAEEREAIMAVARNKGNATGVDDYASGYRNCALHIAEKIALRSAKGGA